MFQSCLSFPKLETLHISWEEREVISWTSLTPASRPLSFTQLSVSRVQSIILNIKRILKVFSGGPAKPNRVHHPHSSITSAHNSSGVGCAFIAISANSTRSEKGKKGIRWLPIYSEASGCRQIFEYTAFHSYIYFL